MATGYRVDIPNATPSEESRIFRPRFSQARPQDKRLVDTVKRLSRGLRKTGRAKAGASKSEGVRRHYAGRGAVLPRAANMQQRAVVKSRIVKMAGRGKALARANINYITRDAVGIDGGESVPFNRDGIMDKEGVDAFIERGTQTRHQFRFIVSPESGAKLDMESFTRDFMARMEKDLNSTLDYVAVIHYDTDNPHAHIVLNGVNDLGEDLVISRDYISVGMRTRAGEIATHQLGHRTEQEIQQTFDKEIVTERVTFLDRKITLIADNYEKDKVVDLSKNLNGKSPQTIASRTNIIGRLNTLKRFGMAQETGAGVWRIEQDFEARLREMGVNNDVRKAVYNHSKDAEDLRHIVRINTKEPMPKPLTGRVLGKGVDNELYDSRYLVVAGEDGNTYYTSVASLETRSGEHILAGHIVTLDNRTNPVKTADKNVMHIAAENDGIYSEALHRQWLETEAGKKRLDTLAQNLGYEIKLDEYIDAHGKRLEYLASKDILPQPEGGKWHVPKDMAGRIMASTHIEHRPFMRAESHSTVPIFSQVKARGLTWVDRRIIEAGAVPVPAQAPRTTFQKDLHKATQLRAAALLEMGMLTMEDEQYVVPKNLGNRLLAMEMQEGALGLSARYGEYAPLDHAPELDGKVVYRGELKEVVRLPSGKYAVIDIGRGFTLVPMQPGMEKLTGKQVQVSMDKGKSLAYVNQKHQRTRVQMMAISTDMDKGLGL